MIRKIIKIQNVGLLQDACAGSAVDLERVTAIYADNGRGKSTLAAIMRACHLADVGRVNARRTIDSPNPPVVDLLLASGAHVEFKGNAWAGTAPTIAVFDSEFVEQNVYSGFEVRPEQRQSLLEFALGDQTVQLTRKIEQLSQAIKVQTGERSDAEKTLAGYATPYGVADFLALQPVADAQEQIDALQKQMQATKNAQLLSARQIPTGVQTIQFDVKTVFDLLERTLADVEQSAEAAVKAHLAKHEKAGFEDWVSRGQAYVEGDECPFCGQGVAGLWLINAYQSYFNMAYSDLKSEITQLESEIETRLSDVTADALASAAETNAARIDAWKDQLALPTPSIDMASLRSKLQETRAALLALVTAKHQQPLAPVGSQAAKEEAAAAVASINDAIRGYNAVLTQVAKTILEFKAKLASEDVKALQASIKSVEVVLRREEPEVVAAVGEYQKAEMERKRLEGEKGKVRAEIDALMHATLQQYQTNVNQLLGAFGAEFSIVELKPSYVGRSGEPRSEYALSLRNKSVKLGSRAELTTGHSFATTLSDGDKRTLAFAFFIARLRADPKLSETIVILDDPVSSLDRNRRHESRRLIARLATECRQLIFLSHDAYFVRDLRDRLADLKPAPLPLGLLTLKRVHHGYSSFAPCDIDDICSSEYYRHHRLVGDYVDGKPTPSPRDVAKAIRPMLEGYYHRRFPGKIPRKLTFGQIIGLALDPATTGPLTNLRPLAQELVDINEYAGQFHHDTNQSADTVQVVESELLVFARRALTLIYQNG